MSLLLHPDKDMATARTILASGGVLAYPTEAVFGLGCDPNHPEAVLKILEMKSRMMRKGLILIAGSFTQLKPYLALEELTHDQINQAIMTWPGPYTWVFPASPLVPAWIRGDFTTVAVRVTAHPVVRNLCEAYGSPIVSTSANRDGEPPLKKYEDIAPHFNIQPDAIIAGEVGGLQSPTQIRDVSTGKILRFG